MHDLPRSRCRQWRADRVSLAIMLIGSGRIAVYPARRRRARGPDQTGGSRSSPACSPSAPRSSTPPRRRSTLARACRCGWSRSPALVGIGTRLSNGCTSGHGCVRHGAAVEAIDHRDDDVLRRRRRDRNDHGETPVNAPALFAGALFSTGACISGMVKPSKVIGFLDFGGVDATPLLSHGVHRLASARARVARRRKPTTPRFGERFPDPASRVTTRLVGGAAISASAGASRLLPGPRGRVDHLRRRRRSFVAAMTAGMLLVRPLDHLTTARARDERWARGRALRQQSGSSHPITRRRPCRPHRRSLERVARQLRWTRTATRRRRRA